MAPLELINFLKETQSIVELFSEKEHTSFIIIATMKVNL